MKRSSAVVLIVASLVAGGCGHKSANPASSTKSESGTVTRGEFCAHDKEGKSEKGADGSQLECKLGTDGHARWEPK